MSESKHYSLASSTSLLLDDGGIIDLKNIKEIKNSKEFGDNIDEIISTIDKGVGNWSNTLINSFIVFKKAVTQFDSKEVKS